jgi:hypothetical protein
MSSSLFLFKEKEKTKLNILSTKNKFFAENLRSNVINKK